jgi:hypothetical protein
MLSPRLLGARLAWRPVALREEISLCAWHSVPEDVFTGDTSVEAAACAAGVEMCGRLLQAAVEVATSVLPSEFWASAHLVLKATQHCEDAQADLTYPKAMEAVGQGAKSLLEVWPSREAATKFAEMRPQYISAALKAPACPARKCVPCRAHLPAIFEIPGRLAGISRASRTPRRPACLRRLPSCRESSTMGLLTHRA